jgi:hypothetical protein
MLRAALMLAAVAFAVSTEAAEKDLAEIDLEPVLITKGDLPAGTVGAQVREDPPKMFEKIEGADNAIYQQFQRDDKVAGGVTVFLFSSDAKLKKALGVLKTGAKELKPIKGIGDSAMGVYRKDSIPGLGSIQFSEMVFTSGPALVHIRMSDVSGLEESTAYAKRLDKRLKKLLTSGSK